VIAFLSVFGVSLIVVAAACAARAHRLRGQGGDRWRRETIGDLRRTTRTVGLFGAICVALAVLLWMARP